ncbi:MAG: CvpA family protein [Marinilabiliaceae bacterium]|nr:CvpA family protein [Marinilabiliaceae bacterium]
MTLLDFIILIIVGISCVRGIFKGFVSELATLVALILGIMGAVFFSGLVSKWLSSYISTQYIPVVAFIILFIGIVICVHLLSKIIDKLLKAISLGWLNKLMGGVFASLKVTLLISIFILVIDVLGFGTKIISPHLRESSLIFSPVQKFAPATFNIFSLGYEHLAPKNRTDLE